MQAADADLGTWILAYVHLSSSWAMGPSNEGGPRPDWAMGPSDAEQPQGDQGWALGYHWAGAAAAHRKVSGWAFPPHHARSSSGGLGGSFLEGPRSRPHALPLPSQQGTCA